MTMSHLIPQNPFGFYLSRKIGGLTRDGLLSYVSTPHYLCADPLGRRNCGDRLGESWRSGCLFKVDFKGRFADMGPMPYPKLALGIPWFASVVDALDSSIIHVTVF